MVISSTRAIEVSIQAVSPELILSLVTVKGAVGAGAAAAGAAVASAPAGALAGAAGAAAAAAGAALHVASSATAGTACRGPRASNSQVRAPAIARPSSPGNFLNTSMRILATPSFSFM